MLLQLEMSLRSKPHYYLYYFSLTELASKETLGERWLIVTDSFPLANLLSLQLGGTTTEL